MPNPIKYSTGSESDALKKGNFHIGTGSVGKGPSDTTGYYQAVSPPNGGYVIYLNNPNSTSDMSYHVANNDSELISFTNGLAGQSYTTVNECLTYFATQTDKVCVNRDYEGIVTDGLIFNLDAGFTPSYPKNGTTWYDVGGTNNGTLTNGPTFSSADGGSIVFDDTDDFVRLPTSVLYNNTNQTFSCWAKTGNFNQSRTLYDRRDGLGGIYGYFVDFDNQGKARGWLYYGAGSNSLRVFSSTLLTNTIYNIVLTLDLSDVMSLYVNGQFQESVDISTVSLLSNHQPTLGFKNGAFQSTLGPLNGNMYNTQIYNRALSADEVLQNYNATKGRFGL